MNIHEMFGRHCGEEKKMFETSYICSIYVLCLGGSVCVYHWKKMNFPLRIFSVNVTNSAVSWVTFTEEIFHGNLHFLRSVCLMQKRRTRKKWNKAIFFFRLWYFHFAFPQKDGCYTNQKITSQLRYLHRRR